MRPQGQLNAHFLIQTEKCIQPNKLFILQILTTESQSAIRERLLYKNIELKGNQNKLNNAAKICKTEDEETQNIVELHVCGFTMRINSSQHSNNHDTRLPDRLNRTGTWIMKQNYGVI